jgi:GT2 family glycosyltransferase
MAIPAIHKMRWRKGKLLLRDIADATLADPASAVKRGFSPPLATWLAGELGEEVADTLTRQAVRNRGVFDPDAVTRTVRRCLAGESSLRPAVMMLYSFEVWAQRWLGPVPSSTAPAVEVSSAPELSVVIVSWNTVDLTRAALRSLEDHLGSVAHEVIVVDNASADGSQEMIAAEFPHVRLIRNSENVGFGRANNQGMAVARGRWFLLLNSDAELTDGSVAALFRRIQGDRTLGIAHCRLVSPDGGLQYTTYRFPSVKLALLDNVGLSKVVPARVRENLLGGYWEQNYERDVDSVAGAFMLLPREVFEETGGFAEEIFMYGEDIEWCSRIKEHGWRVRYFPDATVLHQNHASTARWVDDKRRIAICIAADQRLITARDGRTAATAYRAIRVLGATMRLLYYRLRLSLGGDARERYRPLIPGCTDVLRALLARSKRPDDGR